MNMALARLLGMTYRQAAPGEGSGAGGAGSGAGAGAGAGTGAAAAVVPAAGAGTGEKPWYDTAVKDPEAKAWIESYKGAYPDVDSVVRKAYNLEKFVGAEKAGRGVIVPKPDATAEEWAAFNKQVFKVPEKPDGYAMPQGVDATVAEAVKADPMWGKFQTLAHKIGMPVSHFNEVLSFFMNESKGHNDTEYAKLEQQADAEVAALKNEWPGVEYDKNVELGRRAAASFVPHKSKEELTDIITKMEGALGTGMTLRLWAAIGKGMGEHEGVMGEGQGDTGGVMSPEAARVRIDALKKDAAWGAKYANGDADAVAEFTRLHKIAYPG